MEIALQIVLCIIIADIITGLIHWWEDTYAVPSWPILGKLVAEPNIKHHLDPGFIGKTDSYWKHCKLSLYIGAIVLVIIHLIYGLNWQIVLTTFLACSGNWIHSINHGACRGNKILAFLRKYSIIQKAKHHAKHHVPPFDRDYCVLTNFVNPILEYFNVWKCLEFILSKFGITVKRMTKERNYV